MSNSAEASDSGDTAEWRKQLETSPVSGGYQLFVSWIVCNMENVACGFTSDDQYDRVPPHVLMECG